MRWFRLAAEQGDVRAQYNLGSRYATGDGVPEDAVEAVRWFRLAAEQGDAGAQYNLGARYVDGDGVPENDVLAHMWFTLTAARAQGATRKAAVNLRDILANNMSSEQIEAAQRLAREWNETHPHN